MTVTPEAVRAVLRDGILPEHAPERGGFKLAAEGSCVVVTVAEATHAGQAMPVVPSLSAWEAQNLLDECERDLRLAGRFAVAQCGPALVVGTDLVDVLEVVVRRRFPLSEDQAAVERGRHEIEIKGDAA